jgi:hypothetical protein
MAILKDAIPKDAILDRSVVAMRKTLARKVAGHAVEEGDTFTEIRTGPG